MNTAAGETAPNRPPNPAVEAAAAGRIDDAKSDGRTEATQKKDETKRSPKRHTEVVGAYSIPDFCRLHGGMSEAFFHKLVCDGDGPRLMKVGARTMVSAEAAAEWRCAREAAAQHQTAA
jgi:hypothetical protein